MGQSTRFLGILGWPLARTCSPAMHAAAFRELGLDWVYGAFPVSPSRLGLAIEGARALGFVGLNLTAPHKVEALRYCVPDEDARRVGAVNTIVFDDAGGTRGLNTDGYGFLKSLEEAGLKPDEIAGRPAVVLGGGGAARAVIVALAGLGAKVTCVSRSGIGLGLGPEDEPAHARWSEAGLDALLPASQLLVDASARSLSDSGQAGREVERLPAGATVIDLAVDPGSALVQAARRRGLRAAAGEAMLLHQGAAALAAWSGRAAPVEAMRQALALNLARG